MAIKNTPELISEKRTSTGKGSSRALRRQGKVPAIIYGGKGEEISIYTNLKELNTQYLRGNISSRLFNIKIGNDNILALPRDIQLHPVTDVILHADFLRVEQDSRVNVFIPVKFLNREASPGLKRGGVLSIIRRKVELSCRADSIPELLEIDLSGLKIGDSLHSHNISYPEGVEPTITDRDFTIATIVGKRSEGEAEDGAEEVSQDDSSEELSE